MLYKNYQRQFEGQKVLYECDHDKWTCENHK